jgi:hypothetical protein
MLTASIGLTACDPPGVFSEPSLREYFWDATDGQKLERNDVISTAAIADLFSEVVTAYEPEPGLGENVAIRLNDRAGGYQKVFSFVVTSEMLEGGWVSSWGESVPDGTCEV